jgi:uncharacterized protein YjbJ (UPF0337 family)
MKDRMSEAERQANKDGSVDRVKGHTNEIIGNVKEKVGGAIGDHEMELKGSAQRAEGKSQRVKGEIKKTIDDVADKVKAGAEIVGEKFKEAVHKH